MKATTKYIKTIVLLVVSTTASSRVFAQDGSTLEEIIVTAQKRAESVQDIPIAISAISAEGLQRLGITASEDIAMVAPGLQLGRQTNNTVVFLRGVGNSTGQLGNESSVAMYVDEVYSPAASANVMSLTDVERIEVLKGPQGTLFGRNATGGLVHIITRNPKDDPTLNVKVGYANYDDFTSNLYGSSRIGPNLAASISVYYRDQGEGYLHNSFLNNEYRPNEELTFRSKVRFTPSDLTSLTLAAYHIENDGSTGIPRTPDRGTFGLAGQSAPQDYYDIRMNDSSYYTNDNEGVSLNVQHEFGFADLTSITSWADALNFAFYDQDGSMQPTVRASISTESESVTQELRLSSNSADRFKWVAGLFYFGNKARYMPMSIDQATARGLVNVLINTEQETKSYAAFAEGHWMLWEATGLTTGLRYTSDKLTFGGTTALTLPTPASLLFPHSDESKSDQFSWRIGMDHKFTDGMMGYFTVSRGYKTGNYNLVVTGATISPVTKPEILDAFEVGLKNELMNNRLRLNASTFYYDYSDLQVFVSLQGNAATRNAGAATIFGGELEAQMAFTNRFTAQAGVSLLHATFDEYDGGLSFTPSPSGNIGNSPRSLAGKEIPRSPDLTFHLGLMYLQPTRIGTIGANVNYYYNDGFYWEAENRFAQRDYQIVNASLSWTSSKETWKITAWGKNLAAEEYAIWGSSSTLGDLLSPADPRTYGATVEFSF